MVFAATGPLTIKRDDLETKARNLLEKVIYTQNGAKTFCAEGNNDEEIEFLIKKRYILQKEESPNTKYEITPEGRKYALDYPLIF